MNGSTAIRDDLLLLQCQQGDAASFDQLVRQWQQPLLNYAFRLTGDWAAAQDVVQDTWVVVIRGLVGLRDVARFRPWLFQIASHKCQDHWRRHHTARRHAEAVSRRAEDAEWPPPSAERADIDTAFCRLSAESRTVLALMYLQDFTVSEMAEILTLPEGTVKSRLFHARQQLRQLMEKDYGTV